MKRQRSDWKQSASYRLSQVKLSDYVRKELLYSSPEVYPHPAAVLFASLYMATFCFVEEKKALKLLTSISDQVIKYTLIPVMGDSLFELIYSATSFSKALHAFMDHIVRLDKQEDAQQIEPILSILETKIESVDDILKMEHMAIQDVGWPTFMKPSSYPLFQKICHSLESISFAMASISLRRHVSIAPEDEEELEVLMQITSYEDVLKKASMMAKSPMVELHHLIVYYLGLCSLPNPGGSAYEGGKFRDKADFRISVPRLRYELSRFFISDCASVVLQYLHCDDRMCIQKLWFHHKALSKISIVNANTVEFEDGLFHIKHKHKHAYVMADSNYPRVKRKNERECLYMHWDESHQVTIMIGPHINRDISELGWDGKNVRVTGNGSNLVCLSKKNIDKLPHIVIYTFPEFEETKRLNVHPRHGTVIDGVACSDHYIFAVMGLKILVFDLEKTKNGDTETTCFTVPLPSSYKFEQFLLTGDSMFLLYKSTAPERANHEAYIVSFSME